MSLSKHIQDLVAKAKLSEALKSLTDAADGQVSDDLQNQLTLLSGRFNRLIKEERLGLLSSSDAQIERNRIVVALLELAKEVEDEIKRDEISKMAGAEPDELGIHEMFELIDDSKPLPTAALSALKGYLLRSIPDKMQLHNLHRCLLRIAYDKESLLQDLEKDTPDVVVRDGIRVSEKMQVELIGGDAFEITPLTEKEQILEAGFPTQWDFDVRPQKLGVFPLNFKVAVILPNGKKEIVLTEKVDVVTEAVEAGMEVVVADLEKLKERGGVYTDEEGAEAIVERYTTLHDNTSRNLLTSNDETRRGKPMILMTFAANDLKGVNTEAAKIWETISKQPEIFAQKLENADVEKLAETVIGSENMFMFHYGGHADTKGIVLDGFRHLDKVRFANLLLPSHHHIQFVFLNGCLSYGQIGVLTANNVKAVIATNVKVNDQEAVRFAHLFYKAFMGGQYDLRSAFQTAESTVAGRNSVPVVVNPGTIDESQPMPGSWTLFVHSGFVGVLDWKLGDFLSQR